MDSCVHHIAALRALGSAAGTHIMCHVDARPCVILCVQVPARESTATISSDHHDYVFSQSIMAVMQLVAQQLTTQIARC